MSTKRSVLQHPYEGRGRYTNVSAGPRRILVVDDDPLVATTTQRVLQPEGDEVDMGEVRRGDRLIRCTAREFALMTHFVRHPRQMLTREQLLSAIWADEETDDNVVAVYIGYLRAKLDGAGERRLIQTVRGFGYSLRGA